MEIKKQKNERDCGLCVLEYFIRKEFKKRVSINDLQKQVSYSDKGISLDQLTQLALKYNLELKSFEVEAKDLFESEINKEFIALINSEGYNHFVVAQLQKEKVMIKDSSKGAYEMSLKEFESKFLRVITLVEKVAEQQVIKTANKPVFKMRIPHKPILFSLGFFSTILSVSMMFVSTIFMKVVLDEVIPYHLDKTLTMIVVVFSLVVSIRVANMVIKNIVIKRIQNIYELDLLTTFSTKLFLANKSDLNRFTQNDILRRWGYISTISATFANGFFVLLNEMFVFLISMSMLIYMSSSAFAIVLAFGALMICNILVFAFFSKPKAEALLEKQLVLLNASHDYVRNNDLIKNPQMFNKLSSKIDLAHRDLKQKEMKLFNINLLSKVVGESINLIAPIIITYINAFLIFDNKLGVGQMIMLISSSTFFLNSLSDISSFSISYINFRRENKLFEEVTKLKNEEKNIAGIHNENIKNISFENYKFFYDREIFRINALEISSNLKIIGKNGCGKSTFLKTIAGLEKGQGTLKINNINLDFYALDSTRQNVIYISSDVYLPKMKIWEYLCDDEQSKILLEKNIISLGLNKIIENAKLNLNTEIINGGTNFSAGQKQIISLLKIFAQQPKLLLLDEAFENVDQINFVLFKEALKKYPELIVEISHSNRFVKNGEEVNFENYSSI